jgi:hypothetical protein
VRGCGPLQRPEVIAALLKKSAKLSVINPAPLRQRTPISKSFLVLFFKKEHPSSSPETKP